MSTLVSGWLVEEDGELVPVELSSTNDEEIYTRVSVLHLFGYTPEFYILNKTFFTDRLLALRKAKQKARFEINRISQQIEAYNIEIKRIESERLLGEEPCS